MPYPTQSI